MFSPAGAVDELSLPGWRQAVNVNLTGAYLCAHHAVRMMKARRGRRIINNGSISAHAPRPHSVAYTATKHAITGLTKSISLDGRAFDIACGQIDIGNAATDMTAQMSHGMPQADGSLAPEPTFDAQHVGAAVLYMAGLPLDAPSSMGSPNGDTPLPDGNLLISEINGSWVSEYTLTGKLVWTVQLPIAYPSDPQQIGPDKYLIADYAAPGEILEFNRAGRILYRYHPAAGPGMLNHPSLTELLPSGVFMVNDDYDHGWPPSTRPPGRWSGGPE